MVDVVFVYDGYGFEVVMWMCWKVWYCFVVIYVLVIFVGEVLVDLVVGQ